MENPIFDELSFQIFDKKEKTSKIVSFRKSKNPQIQKVDCVFEKSMSPLKILRIFLRSFLMLNDQNRSDSVLFELCCHTPFSRTFGFGTGVAKSSIVTACPLRTYEHTYSSEASRAKRVQFAVMNVRKYVRLVS